MIRITGIEKIEVMHKIKKIEVIEKIEKIQVIEKIEVIDTLTGNSYSAIIIDNSNIFKIKDKSAYLILVSDFLGEKEYKIFSYPSLRMQRFED